MKTIYHYLSLEIDNEIMAINVKNVLEVLEIEKITPLPNRVDYIKGIINFRNEVVPVIDTRLKFGKQASNLDEKKVIIVVEFEDNDKMVQVGAIADSVRDVIEVKDSEIKNLPAISKNLNREFVEGVVQLEKDFIVLINIKEIFTSDEIIELEELEQKNEEQTENTQIKE